MTVKMRIALLSVSCILTLAGAALAAEIHEAAKSGDIAKIKDLLDKDPGLLYVKDEQGKTPLHWAVGRGQVEAARFLLDTYHVDVNVRNNNEGTPLHVAASQAQPKAAELLIAHGALVDARTKDGATPLHFASYKGRKAGHFETAKILIQHGADVNARTNNGATALSMALSRGNSQIIELLRANGARGSSGRGRSSSAGNLMTD
jgi:ankyrin repeat protein